MLAQVGVQRDTSELRSAPAASVVDRISPANCASRNWTQLRVERDHMFHREKPWLDTCVRKMAAGLG